MGCMLCMKEDVYRQGALRTLESLDVGKLDLYKSEFLIAIVFTVNDKGGTLNEFMGVTGAGTMKGHFWMSIT